MVSLSINSHFYCKTLNISCTGVVVLRIQRVSLEWGGKDYQLFIPTAVLQYINISKPIILAQETGPTGDFQG